MFRAKRVTDPLDEKVKARLVGIDRYPMSYISSGSEHEGVDDDWPYLSDLVQGFFEDDDDIVETNESLLVCDSRSERVDSDASTSALIETVTDNTDPVKNLILFHILKAINVFSCLRSNKPMYRRNVMYYLRNLGFNAAICKAKWESSGGLTAGNYEYIDVAITLQNSKTQNRYIVDLDFAGEFEIARPTEHYSRMLETLPRVFVGKGEEVKTIVKLMCDSSKRSLKSKDLHFPPWRKSRYMLMKWFGPYRRTTNLVPTDPATPAYSKQLAVKCQSVGFETDVNGRYFVNTR